MPSAPHMFDWMTSLADATRARILRVLERHELTVAELCAVLQLPQSTVSRHLKVLADDGWVLSRREATSHLYRMAGSSGGGELDPAARKLWLLLRDQTGVGPTADQDDRRLAAVLAERQSRSQAFFSSAAGQWDQLRSQLFGDRFDLHALAGLLDENSIVGDLGCGTAQVAATIAPFVKRVIAVDESAVMLKTAKQRVAALDNVDLRRGDLTSLPIDDGQLDAAVIMLVLHHLPEPPEVLKEVARTIRPGGKLLIIDMHQHDRREYQQTMGHLWLGFDPRKLQAWLTGAGFENVRIVSLPQPTGVRGPALFACTARRNRNSDRGTRN